MVPNRDSPYLTPDHHEAWFAEQGQLRDTSSRGYSLNSKHVIPHDQNRSPT